MKRKCIAILAVFQFSIANANAQPAIFWFNDPVGPDETVLVTGADLNAVTSASVGRIDDQGSASKAEPETSVEILQANPLSLKFVIPKEFTPGIYRFTLTHAGGSLTGRINLPTIYWTQGDLGEAASPAGWVQVFGRNIVREPGRAQLVLLADDGNAPAKAVLTKGDLWRGAFRVPDELSPGRYRLRLSNGDGDVGAWVDAGSITIRVPDPEPTQSFNVRAYGAIGDGRVDSTRAIKAAIDAASQGGGGIVYFPRGRYLVSETIAIPPLVRIRGERIDLVNLVWPEFADPPGALLQGTSRFSIEDITIYASNHLHVISGGFGLGNVAALDAGDITIRRVRIRASAFRGQLDPQTVFQRMEHFRRIFPNFSGDTIRLTGNRLEVSDCDVLGSGHSLYLLKATNAIISNNILNNGRNGLMSIAGSHQVIFENNLLTGADLQATGGGITTLSRAVSASENVFVGGNTIKAIYGWDREGMTSDGPGGYYFGHAESTAPNRLSLLDAPNASPAIDWVGAIVMVVNGRGAGQFGHIAAIEATPAKPSITLDRALEIPLDRTSEVTIAQTQQNYLIVNNFFEDTGVAAQAYGTALGHVIAGNRSNRTSGFAAFGLNYAHFQPSWQVQILDNQILEGNVYRAGPDRSIFSNEAAIIVQGNQTATGAGRPPLVQAVIVRGNQLLQDAHIEMKGFSTASPGVRDVVVEANTTGPSRVGLLVDRGVASWLGRRNVEERRIPK
jgi:hypothetical protein